VAAHLRRLVLDLVGVVMTEVTIPILTVNPLMRAALSYDPETGRFTRIAKSGPNVVVGAEAGAVNHGYRRIYVGGRPYAAHRLAWLWVHGKWPDGKVDHINGDTDDNRIANLRDVDHSTNLENQRRARSDNLLGVLGVRAKPSGRYEARIWVKGRPMFLGSYPTAEDAHGAYVEAKRKLHEGCTL
jgi:hypothetical protein